MLRGIRRLSTATRLRRAIFYVPGSDERKLKASMKSVADCFVYDLEDSVSHGRKNEARDMVYQVIPCFTMQQWLRPHHSQPIDGHRPWRHLIRASLRKQFGSIRLGEDMFLKDRHLWSNQIVEILTMKLRSGFEMGDLQVILQSKKLQGIVIPKVHSATDVSFVAKMVDAVASPEQRKNIKLIACIESARGVVNAKEIAAADPRVDALVFAAEDYCADTGILRTPSRLEMLYARQAIVTTAVAHGLQAIDLVCVDFKTEAILKEECTEGRQFGFTGKQAIHPAQIQTIHEAFSPSSKEIEWAQSVLQGYADHAKSGFGAFSLHGKMIDMPVVKAAERLLAKAQACGKSI